MLKGTSCRRDVGENLFPLDFTRRRFLPLERRYSVFWHNMRESAAFKFLLTDDDSSLFPLSKLRLWRLGTFRTATNSRLLYKSLQVVEHESDNITFLVVHITIV